MNARFGIAVARASLVDVRDADALRRQVMHGIGVVPEQPEVGGRGGHAREPLDGLLRVHGAGRVAVLRHAPHALDLRIRGDQLLDRVHVGTVVAQRHGDHLDAELVADRKVPVVAGHGADESDARLLRPRPHAVARALEQRVHDCVVHQTEAGIAADDHAIGRHVVDRREQRAQLRQTLQLAVVAAVDRAGHVVASAGHLQQLVAQIELCRRRLAARQVQLQPAPGEVVVAFADPLVKGAQFVRAQRRELGHGGPGRSRERQTRS